MSITNAIESQFIYDDNLKPERHSTAASYHDHSHDAGKAKRSKAHDHAAHDGHGHRGHGEEGRVRLTPQVMREFGVATEKVGPGAIADIITRPAEVTFNMDRFSHVVPHVAGMVRSVNAAQGDVVTANLFPLGPLAEDAQGNPIAGDWTLAGWTLFLGGMFIAAW